MDLNVPNPFFPSRYETILGDVTTHLLETVIFTIQYMRASDICAYHVSCFLGQK